MSGKTTVLALDLEGTIISNAMSQIPRPGLYEFLEQVRGLFPEILMFTMVSEEKFRPIAALLVYEKSAPAWFETIEYVRWHGKTKDLSFIPGADVDHSLLVDDYEIYVHPGQEDRWVKIKFFDYPYPYDDTGLSEVLEVLRKFAAALP